MNPLQLYALDTSAPAVNQPPQQTQTGKSPDWRKVRPTLSPSDVKWIADADPTDIAKMEKFKNYNLSYKIFYP